MPLPDVVASATHRISHHRNRGAHEDDRALPPKPAQRRSWPRGRGPRAGPTGVTPFYTCASGHGRDGTTATNPRIRRCVCDPLDASRERQRRICGTALGDRPICPFRPWQCRFGGLERSRGGARRGGPDDATSALSGAVPSTAPGEGEDLAENDAVLDPSVGSGRTGTDALHVSSSASSPVVEDPATGGPSFEIPVVDYPMTGFAAASLAAVMLGLLAAFLLALRRRGIRAPWRGLERSISRRSVELAALAGAAVLTLAAMGTPTEARGADRMSLGLLDPRFQSADPVERDLLLDGAVLSRASSVSLNASWRSIAKTPPGPVFAASDPADPRYDWSSLDDTVRNASEQSTTKSF